MNLLICIVSAVMLAATQCPTAAWATPATTARANLADPGLGIRPSARVADVEPAGTPHGTGSPRLRTDTRERIETDTAGDDVTPRLNGTAPEVSVPASITVGFPHAEPAASTWQGLHPPRGP